MKEKQEFSILDPNGSKTIAFVIENDYIDNEIVYTLQLLNNTQEEQDGKIKKTFYVEDVDKEATVLMLTMGKNKVVINSAILKDNEITVIKSPNVIKYEPILNTSEEVEYRDFKYTNNLKRPISIIDVKTGEEVKPVLYIDQESGEVIGKCKLMPYKPYIALELK